MRHISGGGFMAMPEPEPERSPQHQPDEDWDYDEADDPARPERVGEVKPEPWKKRRRKEFTFYIMMENPTGDYDADRGTIAGIVLRLLRLTGSSLLGTAWRTGAGRVRGEGGMPRRDTAIGIFRVSGFESRLRRFAEEIVALDLKIWTHGGSSSPASRLKARRAADGGGRRSSNF